MSDELFDAAELFSGDPIYPDVKQVCPPEVVATLTKSQREERVHHLINQAHDIVDTAWELAEGQGKPTEKTGSLCTSCDFEPQDGTLDLEVSA